MGLIILTRPPGLFNSIKIVIILFLKRLLQNRPAEGYGPKAVLENLFDGLRENNFSFLINPSLKNIGFSDTVYIPNNIEALEWAIGAKRKKIIKKIIAGPNLVISPSDNNGVLQKKEIDFIIVPSEWVADFYASIDKNLINRIRIWPAGVQIVPENFGSKKFCLVYKKSCPEDLFKSVIRWLESSSIPLRILNYGGYSRNEYFKLLQDASFMIYLSESDSQGLALQEAWAHNVPTLVWNRGYMKTLKYEWRGKTSAPYLIDQAGLTFSNQDDFSLVIEKFLKQLNDFEPRKYVLNNFTVKKSAEKFIKIIS